MKMQFSTLAQLAVLMGVASAAPKPLDAPLSFDDVILLGEDGAHKLIKYSEFEDIKARGLLVPATTPSTLEARSIEGDLYKRCDEAVEVQVTSESSFLNWDVPMSPVVSTAGGSVAVGVTSGYSIANSLQVTAGATLKIEAILDLSLQISYSTTWTTTETSTITYTVPPNNYGLIVSQPMTRRLVGNYITDCDGTIDSVPFTSDSYTSQSYGNLEWVTGVIRLCNSTVYPVPYCVGDGTHS